MKNFITLLICILLNYALSAQSSYDEAIRQGNEALQRGEYSTAIKKYFAAEAFDPSKKLIVQKKVEDVFIKIDNERIFAVNAKKEAEKQRIESDNLRFIAENQRKITDSLRIKAEFANWKTEIALNQARKLIDAFYFYDDKFALAYGKAYAPNTYSHVTDKFYFIDKKGNWIEKLGAWEKAEQFEVHYDIVCTKVVKEEKAWGITKKEVFLLDTTGKLIRFADNISDFCEDTQILDVSNISKQDASKLLCMLGKEMVYLKIKNSILDNSLLKKIGEFSNLKTLDLSNNEFGALPPEIGNLSNLVTLNLSDNNLNALPLEIGNLSNLKTLNLSSNNLKTLPPEIGNLSNLEQLCLSRNKLIDLPYEIGNLSNLYSLSLEYNHLTNLPSEIGFLRKLSSLGLWGNQLKDLPHEIEKLKNLVVIETEIQEEIPKFVEQEILIQDIPKNVESINWFAGNYGLDIIRKLAKSGDVDFIHQLADNSYAAALNGLSMYFLSGSPDDFLQKSTELGKTKYDDYPEALKWFKKLAELAEEQKNDGFLSQASYYLYNIYFYGRKGIEKNYNESFYWCKKGAELDLNENIQYALADMYKNGYGTEKDIKKSNFWYQRATLLKERRLFRFTTDSSPDYTALDYLSVLINIGKVFNELNEYEKAEKYFLFCQEICERYGERYQQRFPYHLYDVLYLLSLNYEKMKDYSSAIQYRIKCNDLLQKNNNQSYFKFEFTQGLGQLSWYYLFTKEYANSEQSARKALKIDATQIWIKTNLAHALLFQNRFWDAEKLYKELSQTIYKDAETYTQVLLDDFDTLESADAIPKERKSDVEKIKKNIIKNTNK